MATWKWEKSKLPSEFWNLDCHGFLQKNLASGLQKDIAKNKRAQKEYEEINEIVRRLEEGSRSKFSLKKQIDSPNRQDDRDEQPLSAC